ncbi:MAG: hypothetical protein LH645_00585 [Actinomycetia bacterium]|nr:hypothetical protein [Actinomycetes bacterium]
MNSPAPKLVAREPTPVRFVEGIDESGSIGASWRGLADLFPSLRRHKFLAAFDPVAGWYRACVVSTPGSDAITASLSTWTVPGGRYARVRLREDAGYLPSSSSQRSRRWRRATTSILTAPASSTTGITPRSTS